MDNTNDLSNIKIAKEKKDLMDDDWLFDDGEDFLDDDDWLYEDDDDLSNDNDF